MKKVIGVIEQSPLFSMIATDHLENMLDCLNARIARFPKGGSIFIAGGAAERVGLVLSGAVQVFRDDFWGNRAILANLEPPDLFGETFACAGVDTLPVNVSATADSEVMLLDYRKIIVTCSSSCAFHTKLIENMMKILARKNLLLNRKIEVLSARTIRDKLIAYLASQASLQDSKRFEIPFSRQELADYLAVDRSALSRELSAMQKQGIILYHKNSFEFL